MTEPKSVSYVCGSCFHWEEAKDLPGPVTIGDARRGICFGAPPACRAVIDRHTQIQTGQANMRPLTKATERACGAFMPHDMAAQLGLQSANDLNG
jgi:hypothetical protein